MKDMNKKFEEAQIGNAKSFFISLVNKGNKH